MEIIKIKAFAKDDGAVTVDWVVLCAAVVVLATMVTGPLVDSAVVVADTIPDAINN